MQAAPALPGACAALPRRGGEPSRRRRWARSGAAAACAWGLALAGLFATPDAHAQSAVPDTGAQRASFALQLFRETCGAHFADPPKIAEVAKSYAFPVNPPYAAALLGGKRGQVWDASAGGPSALALVLVDGAEASCQVHARDTDAGLLQSRFRALMEGSRAPGIKLEKYEQLRSVQGEVTLEQTGYRLAREGATGGWTFVLATSTPNTPGWHASFTVTGQGWR